MASAGEDEPRPTQEEFRTELTRALRAAGYEGEVVEPEDGRSLEILDGKRIDLAPFHAQFGVLPPARRQEALVKLARFLLHPPRLPDTWAEAQPQVLPLVKRRMEVVGQELRLAAAGLEPRPTYSAEITEHLVFHLGIPMEFGTTEVSADAVHAWGVEPDVAFRRAAENVLARSAGSWLTSSHSPGVMRSPWRDGYDASRLVLPRVIGTAPRRGLPVVIVPTPSMLLVAGSEDEEALFQLALAGRRVVDQEKGIHILRALKMGADGETWEDWLPPPGHPAHESFRFLRVIEERQDYIEQGRLLEEVAEGREVMAMAPLEIQLQALGGAVRTVTTWNAGPPQALPKADWVVLVREGVTLGAVPWDVLEGAGTPTLTKAPGYPTRYLVEDFPEDWQLSTLDLQPWEGPGAS
jgi:hypothetical protein